MKRLTAYVSGNIQELGYRARVVQTANALRLTGVVENLNDGRVKIVAEGDDEKLKWFEEAIDIKNTLIQVSSIDKEYSSAIGEFSRFYKLVGQGETDSRLDKGIEVLKKILVAVEDMNTNLGGKIDNLSDKTDKGFANLGGKIDNLSDKTDKGFANLAGRMDRMLQKQDDLLVEVKDMNASLNDNMDKMLDKQDALLNEVKDSRKDLKGYMDQRFERIEGDVAEIKAALKAKGII